MYSYIIHHSGGVSEVIHIDICHPVFQAQRIITTFPVKANKCVFPHLYLVFVLLLLASNHHPYCGKRNYSNRE